MNLCTVYNLTVLSFVLGAVSVGLFALAVSTDSWLLTRESLSFDKEFMENGTAKVMWIRVWTGLWRLCMVHEEGKSLEVGCSFSCQLMPWLLNNENVSTF